MEFQYILALQLVYLEYLRTYADLTSIVFFGGGGGRGGKRGQGTKVLGHDEILGKRIMYSYFCNKYKEKLPL